MSTGSTNGASVSFANQILPMLKANCTRCHGATQQNAGVRLDSYSVVKTNADRANSAIKAGIMPPTGPLSNDQKQLFQTWMTQGALNN